LQAKINPVHTINNPFRIIFFIIKVFFSWL